MALRHKSRQLGSGDLVSDDVVLVDDAGTPLGSAPRIEVHTEATPLHLAFSTYLFNARGEVLLTRRALGKKTWPGVWTNSCCGHPRPSESLEDAARRRIREELGLTVGPLVPLLPEFRYRAVDASGIVENEICPVFAGYVTEADPRPNPDEVAEWAWVPWDKFADAITATPHVYSPWAALQVPLLVVKDQAISSAAAQVPDVVAVCRDVDALLATEISTLIAEWDEYADGNVVDILPVDLPAWLGELLVGRGKRLRVAMSYWGFLAAGGTHGSADYRNLIRAAAALEALHLFALVHDDVMDVSASRRGRPSAHVEATRWHTASRGVGDGALFGTNIATLLGDLAHTVADRIADDLPKPLRKVWYALCVELVAGQRADLTGAAARRTDLAHAEHVARLKSGRYSIERPLELGALAAGAMPEVVATLLTCGEHIGRAFALRDDYLGVWGDPALTGKPAGDDLLEAKATVLLTLARARLKGDAAYVLTRLGTSDVTPDDIPVLVLAMREAGVDTALEELIAAEYDAATRCLDTSSLSQFGIAGIRDAARAIAWRDA
jgi:geranylgeranyl diphosphate synthase type I